VTGVEGARTSGAPTLPPPDGRETERRPACYTRRVRRRSFTLAVCTALVACGPSVATSGIGASHAPRGEVQVDLSLTTSSGRRLELVDQRGSPVLLFLFATYDGASLATHRSLQRFIDDAPETVVVAVALQPDAEVFSRAFVDSVQPPYTVAFDPAESIQRGTSDLGALEAVPTVVVLDASGRVCARHVGYASERDLRAMRQVALGRGGLATVPPPR